MKITPITKKYANPMNVSTLNFNNSANVSKNNETLFCCSKTIVNSTLNEFSNSRGQFLADIDLTDCYIPNTQTRSNNELLDNATRSIVNGTLKKSKVSTTDLADSSKLAKSKKVTNIAFCGPYPQFLIDQDAVCESYSTVSNGIQDITKSTYCSFGNSENKTLFTKLCGFVQNYLSL